MLNKTIKVFFFLIYVLCTEGNKTGESEIVGHTRFVLTL